MKMKSYEKATNIVLKIRSEIALAETADDIDVICKKAAGALNNLVVSDGILPSDIPVYMKTINDFANIVRKSYA